MVLVAALWAPSGPSAAGEGDHGGKIVFSRLVSGVLGAGNTELFVMNGDGTGVTQLTHSPRGDLEHAKHPLTRHRLLLAHLDYAWPRSTAHERSQQRRVLLGACPPLLDGPCPADGSFMPGWASPEPSPAPFTTVAWRMAHIGFFLNMRANHRFGNRSLTPMNAAWPGSADDAIAWIDDGYRAYREGLAGLTDPDLDVAPEGPAGHIDTRFPIAMNIQHITLELIHHGAEVSLLRDLYRTRSNGSDRREDGELA